jgi:hypothetical protein
VAKHLGFEGIMFPETSAIWGTYLNANYGYERDPTLNPALVNNNFIRWHFNGNLELSAVMLAYLDHTGDRDWWTRRAYPIVLGVLKFFRGFYDAKDERGQLKLEPAQALETWWDTTNPTPDVAGLRYVVDRLLSLPEPLTPQADRPFLESLRDELPPVPLGTTPWPDSQPDEQGVKPETKDGDRILPAERFDNLNNMENPELYAVFPYPLGALGGPLQEEAQRAYEHRRMKAICGWFQDAVHAAMLGRGEEAADMLLAALAPEHATEQQLAWRKWPADPRIRFPGFFGPNCDWLPDQDHGCVSMLALQRMLLQTHNGQTLILPAWPKRWDVSFRLHGPDQTVVEGVCRNGRLVSSRVLPLSEQPKQPAW